MSECGHKIVVNGVQPEWLRDEVGLFENTPGEWMRDNPLKDYAWGKGSRPCPISIRLPADHPYYTVSRWNAEHPDQRPFVYWPGGDKAPDDWDKGDLLLADGEIVGGTQDKYTYWQRTGAGNDIIGYRRVERAVAAPEPDIAAIAAKLSEPERERLLGWRGVWGAAYNSVSEDLMERGLLDREWNLTPLGYRVAKWLRKQNASPEGDSVTLKRMTVEELNALYEEWVMSPEADELATIWLARRLGLLAPDPVPETLPERYARETGREVTPELVAFAEWMEGQR